MTNGNKRNTFLAGITLDLIMETSPNSPTDSSEDSVEVKVEAIASRSKRKLTEPRRLYDGPINKRACNRPEESIPFRPWSPTASKTPALTPAAKSQLPSATNPILPYQYFDSPHLPKSKSKTPEKIRIPIHPPFTATKSETEEALNASTAAFPKLENEEDNEFKGRREQRNYKNMTRERRIEANARERTRVHTISAAFDTLRRAVPAYSHSQKLSKLSVLRIACSYIITLSNILDESPDVVESVENVTRTIQREGKLKKKKDSDE